MIIDAQDLSLPSVIDLLYAVPGKRERFTYERAIRLHQFQTWIYCSDSGEMVRMAGRLAAGALLARLWSRKCVAMHLRRKSGVRVSPLCSMYHLHIRNL